MGGVGLTLEELYAAANEMCRQHWDVDYSGRIELLNCKWKRCNGKFYHAEGDDGDPHIVMSRKRNAERTRDEVLGTLLHELVHWRLFTQGMPLRDIDDAFIAECLRVGAPISGATAAQKAYDAYQQKRDYEGGGIVGG